MYCIKCGKELSDTATFCPECGTKVGVTPEKSTPVVTTANQVGNTTQDLMHHTLTEKERNVLSKRLDNMATVYDSVLSYENLLKRKKVSTAEIVFDAITAAPAIICFFFLIIVITGTVIGNEGFDSDTLSLIRNIFIGIVPFLFCMTLTGITRHNWKKIKKEYDKYLIDNGKFIYNLPHAEYNDPSVLRYMSQQITSYRANTLAELYDKADEHLHRLTVERQNEAIIKNTDAISKKLSVSNVLLAGDIGVNLFF